MTYKCIIIDDSTVHRLAISFLVQNHPKLELVGAFHNPYKGIEAIYQQKADIVFLDILLEDVNSFELLDQIEIPAKIIMNSSWEKYTDKAQEYKVDGFLTKPMQKSEFDIKVDVVLKGFEAKREQQMQILSPYFKPRPNVFQV